MFQKRAVSALLALALSASTAVMCVSDSFAVESDPIVAQILQYNPNTTEAEILEYANTTAAENSTTLEAVLAELLELSKTTHDVANQPDENLVDEITTEISSEEDIIPIHSIYPRMENDRTGANVLPQAKNKGDIFWWPSSTLKIKHNHVGLYVETSKILHAPGVGQKSVMKDNWVISYPKNTKLMQVKTSQANRNKSAEYAKKNLVGKRYVTLNCSQLVWKAYNHAGVDVGQGLKLAVLPDNILKSSKTTVYKTLN